MHPVWIHDITKLLSSKLFSFHRRKSPTKRRRGPHRLSQNPVPMIVKAKLINQRKTLIETEEIPKITRDPRNDPNINPSHR